MAKKQPDLRALWNEVRVIGAVATGMAILGGIGIIYAMTREHPEGSACTPKALNGNASGPD